MRSLTLARKRRKIDLTLSEVEVLLTQADVSPEDRKKLKGILTWMMRSPHPFTKCYKALLAHGWSDQRAKKTCAVLKDVAVGSTKWRSAQSKLSVSSADLAEVAGFLSPHSEEELRVMFSDCGSEDDDLSALEDELTEPKEEPNSVVLAAVDDGELVAISRRGVAKVTSPKEGVLCLSSAGQTVEVEVPDEGRLREVYDELRPSLNLENDEELMVEFVSEFPGVELAAAEEKGGVWKPILRTGRWRVGPWSEPGKPVPMKIAFDGPADPKNCLISLEEVKKSFDNGAKEHVTVPLTKENDGLTHRNRSFDNTGFVRKLKLVRKGAGEGELWALINFTDPEVQAKAIQGSLANVSGGIRYNYQRKRDGKVFPCVLDHVAITNDPWVDGMTPFGAVAASQSDEELDVAIAHLEGVSLAAKKAPYGNVTYADPGYQADKVKRYPLDSEAHCRAAWSYINMPKNAAKYSSADLKKVKAKIKAALKKYGVKVSASQATTEGGDDVADSPEATATVDELLKDLGLSSVDELKDTLARVDDTAEELKKRNVRDTVREWEDGGVPPAVIAAAKPILEQDDGGPALNLSEDGEESQVTVAEIVQRIVEAVPKIDLSDHSPGANTSSDRPDDDTEKELSADEKAERVAKFFAGEELDLSVHDEGGDSE